MFHFHFFRLYSCVVLIHDIYYMVKFDIRININVHVILESQSCFDLTSNRCKIWVPPIMQSSWLIFIQSCQNSSPHLACKNDRRLANLKSFKLNCSYEPSQNELSAIASEREPLKYHQRSLWEVRQFNGQLAKEMWSIFEQFLQLQKMKAKVAMISSCRALSDGQHSHFNLVATSSCFVHLSVSSSWCMRWTKWN